MAGRECGAAVENRDACSSDVSESARGSGVPTSLQVCGVGTVAAAKGETRTTGRREQKAERKIQVG